MLLNISLINKFSTLFHSHTTTHPLAFFSIRINKSHAIYVNKIIFMVAQREAFMLSKSGPKGKLLTLFYDTGVLKRKNAFFFF